MTRAFYLILINTLIASVTNSTVWFAIIFYAFLQTKSVLVTSLMSGIYLTLVTLSGFWFGSLVDRFKKKTVMIWSGAISFILYALAFVVYTSVDHVVFSEMGSWYLWLLVILLLLGVIVGNLRTIALPTLVTILIPEERRDKANGLVGTATGISFLITSVISGVLVGHSGMLLILLGAMVLMIVTVFHLWFIMIPEKAVVKSEQEEAKKVDIKGTIATISKVQGLFALIFFTMFNNFLGGVFMALMDAYGLSLVSVQVWGFLWGGLSTAFIIGGLLIAKFGLGRNPLRALFLANTIAWLVCSIFTLQPSIVLLTLGSFIYLCVVPYIEAAEHTIIQKVVPPKRQGRVFGFAQSIELAASPLTAFAIGPITQFFFIPFMTTGLGAQSIGNWFGTGPGRGIALVFVVAGVVGLCVTFLAWNSRYFKLLSAHYLDGRTERTET